MITSPIIIMSILILALFVAIVYMLHIAQLCADKVDGVVPTESSARPLLVQKSRAERTAVVCFALAFLLAMGLVGTMEAMPF